MEEQNKLIHDAAEQMQKLAQRAITLSEDAELLRLQISALHSTIHCLQIATKFNNE